jgi:hypothetical protein
MTNRIPFATYIILLLAFTGCGGAAEDRSTLGTHSLTIIDTSGVTPLGGTSGTHQDDAAGVEIHTFESANGRYKIRLEHEVMTINGVKYTLEKPSDSIRIVDDRVEVNGVETVPDTE